MNKTQRNLAIFLLATFIWTWGFYFPIVVSGNSPYQLPWMILLTCGGAGPSIVGIAMMLLTYDRRERREYWARCFSIRRIRPPMWLIILLIFPAVFALAVPLDLALGGAAPGFEQLKSLLANPLLWPLVAFISFMSGPWSEEFGWRGYALDPLLKRFGLLRGSAFLGLIWGVWHLPLYFMPGTWHAEMGFKPAGFWAFLVFSLGLSMLMTWVYLRTDRSILAAMLVHFTSNFSAQLIGPFSDRVEILRALLLLATGLTALLLLGQRGRARKLPTLEWFGSP